MAAFVVAAIAICASRSARAGSIFDDDYKPASVPEPGHRPSPRPDQPGLPAPPPAAPQPPPAPPRIRPSAVGPAKPVRYPIAPPNEAACKEAEKLVREVYKDEFSRKSPAEKAVLGLHLLGEAREAGNDASTRFVLYREAIEACTAGKDPNDALEAIDEMNWLFTIDRFGMAQSALAAAAGEPTTSPWNAHLAAYAALSLTAEAVEAGRYADAGKIAMAAQSLSRKSHEAALQAWAADWADQTSDIAEKSIQISGAVAKLKASPDDAEACGEIGGFYAFSCGLWARGLPLLAKGSDVALKTAAQKDLAAENADGRAQTAAAEAWMSASEKQSGFAKASILRRACKWYRAAAPQLTGLTKLTAEKRIGQIIAPQLQHGLTADIYRTQSFAGHVRTRVDPFIDWNWDTAPPDPLVRHDHYSVRWTGWLKAPTPGTYKIIALVDDGTRIWIDGNEVIHRWQQGSFTETASVNLGVDAVEMRIEYYQDYGPAHIGLGWIVPGATRPRAVPTSALYHEPIDFAQMLNPPLKADSDGAIHFMPDTSAIHGQNILEWPQESQPDCLGYWNGLDNWVSWKFTAAPGDYDVQLGFSAVDICNGSTYALSVNGASLNGSISDSGGWLNWTTQDVGRIHLAGGNETLSIKPTLMPNNCIMNLTSVTLTPVKQE